MKIKLHHPWNLTPAEAIALQRQLRDQVVSRDEFGPIKHVAGADVGFENKGRITRAAVAILSFTELTLVEHSVIRIPTTFPYIPGLLSFREIPALLEAFKSITTTPEIILCDGQGQAHPRNFGIASHLGLILDIPSIGVAKSRLLGTHGAVPQGKGSWCPLKHEGKTVGAVLRSREGVKPVYVSSGHRLSLKTAIDIVMACTTRYRLPETTRAAHSLASAVASR
jgi:deoxyribonuclease V